MELCYNLTMKARPYNDDSISLTTLFFLYCAILHNRAKVFLESHMNFHATSISLNSLRKLSVSFFYLYLLKDG